ncbi:5-formyltetrahydrofolate cyclo-ligase [Aspergillus candidus]|uniref:5-formyltetrahydrofolate cyclo-ligase n=1 Tax=Aspergillus candidus TaxID=41067 RepID=A0A2I2FMJ5_ASPCN|nr:5-formyltetrahydrofolate cyclo-ligase [Aspergillus candidus]PLB41845.1 5-formyltetrahydrofolate cyclo-ligase [Aspergillus candidus]
MMTGLQTAKKELRGKIRNVLQQVPAESITNQSRTVTNRLFSLAEYQNAKRIGVYLSMPTGELSTTAIVQDALTSGKEVFVPYIHSAQVPSQPKTSVMDMLALDSMDEFQSLARDRWGIPSLTKDQVSSKRNCFGGIGVAADATEETATKGDWGLDLIVMPGMAFDDGFRRLGHGKGYYDRFLKRYLKCAETDMPTPEMPSLVALALREQLLSPSEEIPVAQHDWPVDIILVGDDRCLVRQQH